MRFMMMGSGGVGGYFGARLAAVGFEVGFVARGAHLKAMKNNGLRVLSPHGDITLPEVRAAADPGELGLADVIFVAVKLTDMAAALTALAPAVGPNTLVISLQNGVEAEGLLANAFGPDKVAAGIAYIAAAVEAPGVIRHIGTNQRIQLGALSAHPGAPVADIVHNLVKAGIDAEVPDDITFALWQKFVFLVGLAATTTITGKPIGEIRADIHGRKFLFDVMCEAAAVGRARGAPLPADFAETRLTFADSLPDAMTSSMAHDQVAGKALELDWLSGAVVRFGQEAGIETPVNNAVVAALTLTTESCTES
jgi:2-dehydropantoate 2-reductase